MGLVGLLIAVIFMAFGAWHFFSNGSNLTTITNDASPIAFTEGLVRYEDAKEQALNVKHLVEQKSADTNIDAPDKLTEKKVTENREAKADEVKIINRLMTSGFAVSVKARAIDTIVLHSSYDLTGQDPYSVSGVIQEYGDYGVSAHYLIDRAGTVYRLVEDKDVAYHAGASQMPDGRKNVNDFSLGIEMLGTLDGQYTEAQYKSVNELIDFLKIQYPIKFIVGHKDIAPGRKTDPWNFDWTRLKF